MRLAIVTINYNGSDNTLKLLDSLSVQADRDFLTIVVDNASEPSDREKVAAFQSEGFSWELIKNSDNLGFSGGNNVGIKRALGSGADWVFLLNNDALPGSGFVASLKAELSRLEGVAGVAMDEGDRIAYAGELIWLVTRGFHIYDREKALNAPDRYIIGGGMAIHKDVFGKIGFLDENYFLYFEDQDFSVRAVKAGFKLNVLADIKVAHSPSSSTKKLGSPLLLRYHYRNSLYFNRKNGPTYIKFAVWPWSFWIMKKQLFKIMFQYKPHDSLAILRGVIDFYKGRMGKINS